MVCNVCGQDDQLDQVQDSLIVFGREMVEELAALGAEDAYCLSKMMSL